MLEKLSFKAFIIGMLAIILLVAATLMVVLKDANPNKHFDWYGPAFTYIIASWVMAFGGQYQIEYNKFRVEWEKKHG